MAVGVRAFRRGRPAGDRVRPFAAMANNDLLQSAIPQRLMVIAERRDASHRGSGPLAGHPLAFDLGFSQPRCSRIFEIE
jgi:hypothetical protein